MSKSMTGLFCAVSIIAATGSVVAADAPEEVPPVGRLPGICQAAKAQFRPLTEADLQERKVELVDAVARLDRRIEAAGQNGADWGKYLQMNRLRAQLEDGKVPDPAVLDEVYKRCTAGNEGLELVWFLDLRHALRRYKGMAPNVGNPELQTRYGNLLDFLAGRLQAYAAEPTENDALLIGRVLRQLEEFHQAPALVSAIRHHYQRPNLLLRASAELVTAGITYPVDETGPFRELILGTDVHGTGRTTGQVRSELIPDESRALIGVFFQGDVTTRNVGYNGPVTVFSNGATRFNARKRLWIDATGLDSVPAVSNATAKTTFTGIRARRGSRCIERIAWKRACKQKSQAEHIAARRTEKRLDDRVDQQVAESLGKANRAFTDKFRKPLSERKLFPQLFRFSTTRTALHLVSLEADDSQLAASTAPPEPPERVDLALSLHESMINNLATSALAGITFHDKAFEAVIIELLGELPEQLKADEDQQGWAITFSEQRQPIYVRFAENQVEVAVRGRSFYTGGESYPGMDVTAVYQTVKTEQGFKAVRQGDLQILPPDFVPGKTKFTPRQIAIRARLERRFGKIFKREMMGEGFVLPGKWEKAGKMMPVHLVSQGGWLTIAWKLTPAEQAVARAHDNRQQTRTPF
jgi:hypothetical protein